MNKVIGIFARVGFKVLIFRENVFVFLVEDDRATLLVCAKEFGKFLAKKLLFAFVEGSAKYSPIQISDARLNHRRILGVISFDKDCIDRVDEVFVGDGVNVDMVL